MSAPERRRQPWKGRVGVKPKRDTPRRRTAPRFDTEGWDLANMLLFARSRGRCERCGERVGTQPGELRAERHHRQRRRDGGDRLANLLLLCARCHRRITDRPESETRARERGYIVSALGVEDPAAVPVLLWGDTWVLLDDGGQAHACDPPN